MVSRCWKPRPLLISLLLGLMPALGSSAGPVEGLVAESDFYHIELVENTQYPDFQVRFRILSKSEKKEAFLESKLRNRGLQDLRVTSRDRAVVVGKLPRGGDVIGVLDLKQARHQDTIWCYKFAFSESQRYLAYQTHYPRMGMPEYKRSIVLLYDLESTDAGNRPDTVQNFSYSNAGLPIFPESNLGRQSYDVTLQEAELYLSPFLWSEDESTLVFVSRTEKAGNELVLIDVERARQHDVSAAIHRRTIDVSAYADFAKTSDHTRNEIEAKRYRLACKDIQWSDTGEVTLTPYPQAWLPETFTVKLPETGEAK